MTPLKLLIITPWYPNRLNGNDGNFVRNLTRLALPEYRVTVLAILEDPEMSAGDQTAQRQLVDNLDVIHIHYSGAGARVQRRWARRKAWRTGIQLLDQDYHLIHAHVLIDGGIVAARLSENWDIPFVVSEHASRWLKPWPTSRIPERLLAKWAANKAAAILPVSKALATGLAKHGIDEKVSLFTNPVDETHFYPPETSKTGGPFTFLHVSDFTPNKRIDLMVAAFRNLCDQGGNVELVIAGDGDKTLAQNQVDQLWGRANTPSEQAPIEIIGPLSPKKIGDLMRNANVFLLASEYETQSIVLLEAQLCGLPAISTRSGGPESVISTPLEGDLVEVGQVKKLQQAMANRWANGPMTIEARLYLAAKAKALYGNEAVKERLMAIYQKIQDA